jgi:hypothetical protein
VVSFGLRLPRGGGDRTAEVLGKSFALAGAGAFRPRN